MNLQEIIKKYLEDDKKATEFLEEMKTNKIFTASEENLDTRYSKLKGDYDNLTKSNQESLTLIEQLKKASKGNEDMQSKITDYESKLETLQKENEELKVENALKVELLSGKAKPSDIDYLLFKYKQDNTDISLDENGKVKGFDIDKIKTTFPSNFEVETKKEVDVNALPNINKETTSITKEEFNKMGYLEKNKLFRDDRETYDTLNK